MDKLTKLNKSVDAKLKRLAAVKVPKNAKEYEAEVEKLEDQGMSTSDAQGVVDAAMKKAGVKLSKKLAGVHIVYKEKWEGHEFVIYTKNDKFWFKVPSLSSVETGPFGEQVGMDVLKKKARSFIDDLVL